MLGEIPGAGRWLVSTACHDCFVDVEADREHPWVSISLFSHHGRHGILLRLRRAWRALRGEADDFIEFWSPGEADDMIMATIEARELAFGMPPEQGETELSSIWRFGQG